MHRHPFAFSPTSLLKILTLTLALLLIPQVPARSEGSSWCGTEANRTVVAVARHQESQRLERHHLGMQSAASAPRVYPSGQVAVIEDDGTLVHDPNPFDFSGRSIQFLRRPKGTSAVRSHLAFKQLIGERYDLDGGSTEIPFPAGFRFPFFEGVYDSVWLNADGNVTFGEGDEEAPDFQSLLGGPPRIAALWADLDPSPADGGVYVNIALPGRVRITWLRLPEVGTGAVSTAQLTLFTTGRAVVTFGEVNAVVAIVGVSPGAAAPQQLRSVDYDRELPLRPEPGTLAEVFAPVVTADIVGVIKTFHQHFQDRYSHLILWTDFDLDLGGATAFAVPVKNDVRGIGYPAWDFSNVVGTEHLSTFVQMGSLAKYPDDPDQSFLGTFSTIDLLGHEFAHQWLTQTRFLDGEGSTSTDLLGRDLQHWSFYLDSDGSLMEGNDLVDNNDGTFTTTDATMRFSLLDQYLMGLIPAGEVPPFYYVRATDGPGPAANPRIGVTFSGERVDLCVQDVIDAVGPRQPTAEQSPKTFRTAFVLLGREGEPVSTASLEKLDGIRKRWQDYIQEVTDGRARVGTQLLPR